MHPPRALVAALIMAAGLGVTIPAAASSQSAASHGKTIVIGSTNFTEQVILANIYNDVLTHAGYKTQLKVNLGNRAAVEPAFAHGQLDLYPEYAGSLLLFLNAKAGTKASLLSTDIPLLDSYLGRVGGTTLVPAPAVDTNVFAVTKATASKDHLTTLSSLKKYASKLILGGPPECPTFYFCKPGLQAVYGLKFKNFVSLDEAGPISVAALKSGRAQVVEFFSSDGNIVQHNFVQLADDKHLQPADHVVPVIKKAVATTKVQRLLNAASSKLTTSVLTQLNLQAAANHDPAATAHNWLRRVGLI